MKKKILIAIMLLLLPVFVIINSLADESNEANGDGNIIEVNNDIMINSPLFTKKEKDVQYTQPEVNMIMEGFELVTTKGNLSLYVNKTNGAMRVQNNVTKFVWASDVLNISDYSSSLNPEKTRVYTSPFVLKYLNEKNNESFDTFSTSNGVTCNVKLESSGYSYDVSVKSGKSKIKFSIEVTLLENGINVNVPYKSIEEKGINIKYIGLFPNFGAAYGPTVPGYIFIPSGNGGLVRYDSNPSINGVYKNTYYGNDINRTDVSTSSENSSLSLPIYGIVHGVNQNAVLTTINSGSSFAEFTYEPSNLGSGQLTSSSLGKTYGFHKVYNVFRFKEDYKLSLAGNAPITMIPEKVYEEDVNVTYEFLEGDSANYVGMAKAYQNQLKNKKVLTKNSNSGSGNVHIDVLGAETEKGIVFDKFIKMTTTEQLLAINDELSKKLSNKFLYTLRGFNKNGYSYQNSENYKFDSRLGSLKDLHGLDYYMYYNPIESYGSKPTPNNDNLVNIYNQKYYYTVEEEVKYKYYSNVASVSGNVNKAVSTYNNSIAIDGLNRLYGDHNNEIERHETMEIYKNLFDNTMPMYKPNEYLLANTSHYLNMPLYHDKSRFITDSVPFLQIALRGYVDYYSTYINFSTNQEIDVLKCIEYGSNLAYLISAEESYLISNTLSSHMYATHYESNKDQILEQINKANFVLEQIKGQEIIDRIVIETGVIEVVYENNVRVFVNYNTDELVYKHKLESGKVIEIPSMDYKVVS